MTKPLYFYNGTTFEQVGPTTPQSPIAYQTSAPTGPATGDLWIDSDGDVDTYNRQLTRYYFVATAAQTTISGVDANSLTLAYVAGSEAVYVNGALQVRGQDYTATNGTSVVLSSGLAVNDVVEIFAYTAFTVANAYTKTETDGVAAAAPGMRLVVPSSVSVGSGSGSVNANGFVTFTTASSVSLNDVFSTTYDNYKIVMNLTACSASSTIQYRMRVSGADNTASTYNDVTFRANAASGSTTQNLNQNVGTLTITHSTTITKGMSIDMFSPFLSAVTTFNSIVGNMDNVNNQIGVYITGGGHNTASSFTGISLFPSSGTFTGTVAVYGYKD